VPEKVYGQTAVRFFVVNEFLGDVTAVCPILHNEIAFTFYQAETIVLPVTNQYNAFCSKHFINSASSHSGKT